MKNYRRILFALLFPILFLLHCHCASEDVHNRGMKYPYVHTHCTFRDFDSVMENGRVKYWIFKCKAYDCGRLDTFPKVTRQRGIANPY